MKYLHRIVTGIDHFNDRVGRGVSWLSLFMVLVTFLIVILRYVFNMGWIWMQESVVYMHGTLFMVAGGYTLLSNGHVRVDIFYRPMSEKAKAWIDLFGVFFLLFPTCALIIIYGYPYVSDAWTVKEGSREAGGIDAVFLLKSIILVFPALLGVQGLSQAGHSLLKITNFESDSESVSEEPRPI